MGWTCDIEHTGGTTTVDDNYRFDFSVQKQVTARDVVEYVDFQINIKGHVVAATPGDVADETKALVDLAAIRMQPVTVTIKLDGVEKWKFTPAGSDAGPHVLTFDHEPATGNGASRWAFILTIFMRLPGNNFSGLYDLRTQLTVSKNISGQVVQKVWEAVGKATSIEKAVAGILKFKPSGKVSEQFVRGFDPEPTASATWIWRPQRKVYNERIIVIGGTKSWEVDRQAGVNVAPILHLARRDARVVRLDGEVQGAETDRLAAPPGHWSESATMKRQEALETQSFPTTGTDEERALGLKTLAYQEIWVCTANKVLEPNHGQHGSTQASEKEPADGVIAR